MSNPNSSPLSATLEDKEPSDINAQGSFSAFVAGSPISLYLFGRQGDAQLSLSARAVDVQTTLHLTAATARMLGEKLLACAAWIESQRAAS